MDAEPDDWSAGAGACPNTPGWLLVTDGFQPLGGPWNMATYQVNSDYPSMPMRGATAGGYLPLADGGQVGMLADLNRLAHLAIDGFDPDLVPMRIADYTKPYNASAGGLPSTWPKPVESYSADTTLSFAPGGACTIVASSSQANNIANADCAWSLLSNELDATIGNPNGSQDSGGGAWPTMAPIDYPGNALRLFYNPSNNGTTGSAHGVLDYELDVYNFKTAANVTGTGTQTTITCSTPCVNWKHLGATVQVVGGSQLPAGTKIKTMSVPATASSPQTVTLTAAVGTTFSAQAINVQMVARPRTTTGQYGFLDSVNTGNKHRRAAHHAGGARHPGREHNYLLNSNLTSGANWVEDQAVRIGGRFQPVFSTPAGSPSTVTLRYNQGANLGQATSMEARPTCRRRRR